jgi:hypothetical protein
MTPKEKAEDLFSTYRYALSIPNAPLGELKDDVAKKCALVAVDEIINNNSKIPGLLTQDTMRNTWYWQEVKQEIEKL